MPSARDGEIGPVLDYKPSGGNDVVWFANDTESYVNWSKGNDVFYAPDINDRQETS